MLTDGTYRKIKKIVYNKIDPRTLKYYQIKKCSDVGYVSASLLVSRDKIQNLAEFIDIDPKLIQLLYKDIYSIHLC